MGRRSGVDCGVGRSRQVEGHEPDWSMSRCSWVVGSSWPEIGKRRWELQREPELGRSPFSSCLDYSSPVNKASDVSL